MSTRAILPQRTTGEPGERILRYTLVERVHHWVGALFYIYCLITGLAFWSPYMFWLAALVGGGPTARFWHPWLGLAFTASMFWMYKMWRGDMATTEADLRWKKAVKHYIENDDQNLPPEGRFNWGQKVFFWLMFYGVILLVLSGLWAVVRGIDPVEFALAPTFVCHRARCRRSCHHWRFHHSRLHGNCHDSRRVYLDHSRRSFGHLGEDPPSPLVRAGHRQAAPAEMKRSKWDQRIQRADELTVRTSFRGRGVALLQRLRDLPERTLRPRRRSPGERFTKKGCRLIQ